MTPGLRVTRTNSILYCERWSETVSFYRDVLGLAVTYTTDWFVEFHLCDTAHLGVADARRTSIEPGHGHGITLSWQVGSLARIRRELAERGVTVSEIAKRWNSNYVELHDPEGTRIELWTHDS